MRFTELVQYFVTGLSTGSVYALTAVGITLVYRATGWINLLQGEFVMVGGMTAAVVANRHSVLLAAACAVVVVGVFALIVCDGVLAVVAKRTKIGEALVVAQFAVVGLDVIVVQLTAGTQPRTIRPFSGYHPIKVGGVFITPQQLWVIGTVIVVVTVLNLYLEHTWAGRAMRATASNPLAAQLSGVKPTSVRRRVLILAGIIGAIAGVVVTPSIGMTYASGLSFTVSGFVGAVVGGFGSVRGALVGGLAIGELNSFTAGFGAAAYSDSIVFGLLLLVLVVKRRQGSSNLLAAHAG